MAGGVSLWAARSKGAAERSQLAADKMIGQGGRQMSKKKIQQTASISGRSQNTTSEPLPRPRSTRFRSRAEIHSTRSATSTSTSAGRS